jgi:hypothetical protein
MLLSIFQKNGRFPLPLSTCRIGRLTKPAISQSQALRFTMTLQNNYNEAGCLDGGASVTSGE